MDGYEQDFICGTVDGIVFTNEENGYTVLKLDTDDGIITVVGTIPFAGVGEFMQIYGTWTNHPSYGAQFSAVSIERDLPENEKSILAYLSSRAIRGVGPQTAQKLVAEFGDQTLKIIENDPEKLSVVNGITKARAREIGETFRYQTSIRSLMTYLADHALPVQLAIALVRDFGNNAIEKIRQNPYLLTSEQYGVEFLIADKIALDAGYSQSDPIRIGSGVCYELLFNSENGHVFVPDDKLAAVTAQLTETDVDTAMRRIDEMVGNGELIREKIKGINAIYLPYLHDAETTVYALLKSATDRKVKSPPNLDPLIEKVAKRNGITYEKKQREAIEMAASRGVFILTGGPGTGKTTTVRGIVDLFGELGLDVALAAPTGRAAKKLSEVCDMEAKTIHRLLEMTYNEGGLPIFGRDEDTPLDADAIIIDETSMVDITLMSALLRSLKPTARMIFIGDADQLPSVGPGNVLRDMVRSEIIPTICLTEIFRQAQGSRIVTNAHAINHGEMPELADKKGDFFFMRRETPEDVSDTIVELCRERLPKNMKIHPEDIQVICPTKKTAAGTVALNAALQRALNPPSSSKPELKYGNTVFRKGDRVMQIKNNYDLSWTRDDEHGEGVFNGDIGIVTGVDESAGRLGILFDDRYVAYPIECLPELDLAYAMTVHKSQGSEFKCVIFSASNAARTLMSRQILYTAVTRAKSLLVAVGNPSCIATMVGNAKANNRYSALRVRLAEEI